MKDDLIGQKFNHLTVVKLAKPYICTNGHSVKRYLCECDCGSHKKVTTREIYLRNGHTKSCGCSRIINITGHKYGRLLVLEMLESPINGKYMWKCLCDCGTTKVVASNSLRTGSTKSCGCLSIEKSIENGKNNKKHNKYDLSGEYGVGWTTNTNKEFIFDLEDYNKIKDYTWYESYGHITSRKITIQKLLLNSKDTTDHIDRNPYDNRKENLRECTQSQNSKNQSKPKNSKCEFMGISFCHNKYEARIGYNKKKIHLGSFDNINDAIIARLKAEKKYFGEFAPQKDLFEKYNI